jgi:hypothetical protein
MTRVRFAALLLGACAGALAPGALAQSADARNADARSAEKANAPTLVSRHQRCVIDAFARKVRAARKPDPTLLQQSVEDCESLLAPLRRRILRQTHDAKFAESMLAKIRQASKRGVTVAFLGFLATRPPAAPGK